jgi:hypothetical protein
LLPYVVRPKVLAPFGSKPRDIWTSPSGQQLPCGACGHFVDNTKIVLSTKCPLSIAFRPQTHRLNKNTYSKKTAQFFMYSFDSYGILIKLPIKTKIHLENKQNIVKN